MALASFGGRELEKLVRLERSRPLFEIGNFGRLELDGSHIIQRHHKIISLRQIERISGIALL